jgi:flagellar hook-length control protein FliK
MNAPKPPSIQLNAPPRAAVRPATSAPDRGHAPSFDDAMKHASAAPAAPAEKPDAPPSQHGQPAQPQGAAQAHAQVPGTRHGVGSYHEGKAESELPGASGDADATVVDATDSAAAALADAATSAAQNLGQGISAGTQPASDGKAAATDTSTPAQPAADPANGQAIAAAMLALIQQSVAPASPATTAVPAASPGDARSTIADDIGAAITASSKMAQALTGSLGGAVAGTVADAATGVVGKAVGLVGDAVAGLFGQSDKSDPSKAAQLPDPAQLATGQAPQATPQVSSPVALQSTQAAGTPAFANELGQQIAWMSNGDIKEATIRLHPEDMGQLDVKISVHQNRVDVAFAAQHPAAVQAVNQTLTQLDTMLAHHGLQLGQAQVGQQQAGQGGQGNGGAFAQAAQGGGEPSDAPEMQQATVRAPHSLVDDFA